MPKIYFAPRFNKAYLKFTKLNQKRIDAIDRIIKLFASNPKHPSLNLEKLVGVKIWTIRIDRSNRLFFAWSDQEDTALFFFVGPHDSYKTIKK